MENKNSNKGIVIALCTVIIVLIASIAYILFSGVLTFNTEKKETNKTEEKENKDENKDEDEESVPEEIDLIEYKNIYSFVQGKTLPFGESGLRMEEVFVSQDWTNKSLTDDVKLAMYVVINGTSQFQYDRAEGYISVYKLSQNEVLNGINEIFGIDNGYNHTSVGPVAGCMDLKYNSNNAVYELYDQRGCGDMSVYLLKDKIFKTVKKGDSIEVTEKFYFVLGNEGVYKDFKFTQKIADLYDQNNSDYYFENGSTVTYTFKLAEDGSYYFDNSKITY